MKEKYPYIVRIFCLKRTEVFLGIYFYTMWGTCCCFRLSIESDWDLPLALSGPSYSSLKRSSDILSSSGFLGNLSVGIILSVDDTEMKLKMEKPGVQVLSLDIDKDIVEDVENRMLYVTSNVYKNLAKDPELRHGYIVFTVSEALNFPCHVSW